MSLTVERLRMTLPDPDNLRPRFWGQCRMCDSREEHDLKRCCACSRLGCGECARYHAHAESGEWVWVHEECVKKKEKLRGEEEEE